MTDTEIPIQDMNEYIFPYLGMTVEEVQDILIKEKEMFLDPKKYIDEKFTKEE